MRLHFIPTMAMAFHNTFIRSNNFLGLSKSFLQSETHPVRQQKSSSYEDDESSHQGSASPETGKVRHESTSSSGSSSKRSIGSRGSPDDQARLLESADQELMDEMVVRDDVDDVAFGRQKETIEEEKSKNWS